MDTASASDAAPTADAGSSLPMVATASVQPGGAVTSQISAQTAVQVHHASPAQPSAGAQNANGTAAAKSATPSQSLSADANAAFSADGAFAVQKHNFVAAALHEVSSSVASVIQAPFNSATPALSKNPAPAALVAPSPSTTGAATGSQLASGGGSSAGSGGQSSSGHGGAQSGGSSPQDAFTNPVAAGAPAQSIGNAAAINASAMRADANAVQSAANASASAASGEKTSGGSELASELQNAASSASTPSAGAALPGAQVSQAHLLADNGSGSAEIRISVNNEILGPIELRATSDKDRIGAVIAAAKPETQELLNSELPTLHQALSERNLQVQQLTVSQSSFAGGMFGRGSYSPNPDAWQKQAAGNYWQPPTEAAATSTEDQPGAAVTLAGPGKLSVHV
jgi:hypothetical protein